MSRNASPMLEQWERMKRSCGDAVLLFRCGDFYETFGPDAVTASRVLDLTLTKKHFGKGIVMELAGVPYHAVQSYIYRLTRAGYRVALCEQTEDPSQAKGLVKRDIVRTITPGTIIDAEGMAGEANNYLAAVDPRDLDGVGLAYADISTGEFRMTLLDGEDVEGLLLGELSKIAPSECLIPEGAVLPPSAARELAERGVLTTSLPGEQFDVAGLEGVEVHAPPDQAAQGSDAPHTPHRAAMRAAAAVFVYTRETQGNQAAGLDHVTLYRPEQFVLLDAATERNLDLVRHSRQGGRAHTLLGVLDQTRTSMGARLLKQWILRPLFDPKAIMRRLDAVEALSRDSDARDRLMELLRNVSDLERLIGRVGYGNANARDLLALANSLAQLPGLLALLEPLTPVARALVDTSGDAALPEPLPQLVETLQRALREDPPTSIREGNMFRQGYHAELDELHTLRADNRGVLARLQQREREATGINSLKVAYNKVFGYYIEISKANQDRAPEHYVRKQTLVNAERFITDELKQYEEKILGAQERIESLEYELFQELLNQARLHAQAIRRNAHLVAQLDVLTSLALAALHHDYVRPTVDRGGVIDIAEGRHPVIEHAPAAPRFVPNDLRLDNEKQQLLIITGPNMAGKSTYIRQAALLVLMAQLGSFVPARSARVGVVDRIFSRVGASDNLAAGQSTFMVEMSETAAILAQATPRSLVILDEIGRGTSTFDGVSLAWSIAEYIHNLRGKGVKALFATHYHELAELEQRLTRCCNLRVMVAERGRDVTFLYRIEPGASDHSYGIAVAELAGVPAAVTERARRILKRLEAGDHLARRPESAMPDVQLSLFSLVEEPLAKRLEDVDVDQLTPVQALQLLSELKAGTRGGGHT